jgi:tetratricopeptide (TPR) repeat protein
MAPTEEYSRADVRRKFDLSERQLRSWERRGLLPAATSYSFADLIALQTLIKLKENHISGRQIHRALEALRRKLHWVKQPLSELRIVSHGRKITVHLAGQRVEALTGQILFDFEACPSGSLAYFPDHKRAANRIQESEAWFQKGLELEETGAPVTEAIHAYRKALEFNPQAPGALVNLGTIYYRERKFTEAERYYRAAAEADPNYPLAQFNLANLCDEQGRLTEALKHYQRALQLNPKYADAHFNLALLFERMCDNLKAVHHWQCYLKLDKTGQWADIARRQLERLRQLTVIQSR